MRKLITTAALAALTALAAGCSKDEAETGTEAETEAAAGTEAGTAAGTANGPRQRRGQRLARYDKNGDGKLDDAEREALRAARVDRMLSAIDSDGDGAISRDEAAAFADQGGRRARMLGDFARLDADGDGSVTRAELGAALENRGWRGGRRGPRSE